MKSLDDVKEEMSKLYDQVANGSCDLKHADTLANIAGKYLKAEQLQLAKDIFLADKSKALPALAKAA